MHYATFAVANIRAKHLIKTKKPTLIFLEFSVNFVVVLLHCSNYVLRNKVLFNLV